MRSLPLFLSLLSVGWASLAAMRFSRELTWAVPAYLLAQLAFAFVMWAGMETEGLASNGYRAVFHVSFYAVLGFALVATLRFLATFPEWIAIAVLFGLMCACFGLAEAAYWRVGAAYRGKVPVALLSVIWQGVILLFAGSVALASLISEQREALRICAKWCGIFWLALGLFFLCYAIGILRTNTVWDRRNQFVPSLIALACFGWMAYSLTVLQTKPLREANPEVVMEAR